MGSNTNILYDIPISQLKLDRRFGDGVEGERRLPGPKKENGKSHRPKREKIFAIVSANGVPVTFCSVSVCRVEAKLRDKSYRAAWP